MSRPRTEYHRRGLASLPAGEGLACRAPTHDDREGLAALMLAAYRGTIDDEGEGLPEALDAIDHYFEVIDFSCSRVVGTPDDLVAMCFVLDGDDMSYIDPIAVAASHKQQGLARALVTEVLGLLHVNGVAAVGATITDGNTASERLFVGLGFEAVGPWPRR